MGPSSDVSRNGTSIFDVQLTRLSGEPDTLDRFRGDVMLAVNVASRCGKTPQYRGLQGIHERFATSGFTVLGFPCNQFAAEEPGSSSEIEEFCRVNYGVTFPMFSKLEVNGDGRHPLYRILTRVVDDAGVSGDVAWNFEKFLIDRKGRVVRRFRPTDEPDDPKVVSAIEAALADDPAASEAT